MLPTEKRLVVSFWTFFLGNHSELEKMKSPKTCNTRGSF